MITNFNFLRFLLFTAIIIVTVSFLSGCTNELSQKAQDRIDGYTNLAEQKVTDLANKAEEKVDAAINETINEIKKKLSEAAKQKIDEWLDQNLPTSDQEDLTNDDYAKLIQEHPELQEILED